MQFTRTKVEPTKREGKGWLIAKVILVNWTLFTLLVAAYALWQAKLTYKEMEKRLDVCQTNMERINEQVSSGRIILDLKKK